MTLEVEATHIPQNVEVSVEGLEDGTHITAGELTLPRGATLVTEADTLVVGVALPPAPVEDEAEESEEGAEAEGDEAPAAEESAE